MFPDKLRAPEIPFESARVLREYPRIGALEREDRLLVVTDGEQRARDGARPGTGGEFIGERSDDLPLPRARVLRFVDQDVVDAKVQLVEHPGRGRVAQQRQRLVDQIVIIEQSAPLLLQSVTRDDRVSDSEQGARAV